MGDDGGDEDGGKRTFAGLFVGFPFYRSRGGGRDDGDLHVGELGL